MDGRARFRETMAYGASVRVPYFEEGIRDEVLEAWRKQGMKGDREDEGGLRGDRREEIALDIYPRPAPRMPPTSLADLGDLERRLRPDDRSRLPKGWKRKVRAWRSRDHVLMLRAHHGFFLSMGVGDWSRFLGVMYLLHDDPELVRGILTLYGELAAELAHRVLDEVDVDAVVLSEPIGGNDGPLMSPQMYEQLVLPSYVPLLETCARHGVETVIFRTYANARVLLPCVIEHGFNCLWACEVNMDSMDYLGIRRELGRDLRLIGGIDLDVLHRDGAALRRELEATVPPLLADGGFVPLADGRVREDVPYPRYLEYRKILGELIAAAPQPDH